jgi:hypothetical protein
MRAWKDGDHTVADALQAWYILPSFVREFSMYASMDNRDSIPALGCRLFIDHTKGPGEFYIEGYQFAGHDSIECSLARITVNNDNA